MAAHLFHFLNCLYPGLPLGLRFNTEHPFHHRGQLVMGMVIMVIDDDGDHGDNDDDDDRDQGYKEEDDDYNP